MKVLGVMQGRLLPKYQGRYQAFPVHAWQQEFRVAKSLGLDCIEFILDQDTMSDNPLMSEEGINEIQNLAQQSGVRVITICADYFMNAPLFAADHTERQNNISVLKTLMHNAALMGVTDIVIPCVDQSSMKGKPQVLEQFIKEVKKIIPLAEQLNINLSLETDLEPQPFKELVEGFNSKHVTINYDIGNSASWGYDVRQEMQAYGKYISTVHVKDRKRNAGPVPLGEGDADIPLSMSEFKKHRYQGPIVLQAYRDDEGLEMFKRQLDWFRPILEQYFPEYSSLKKA